MIRKNIEKEIRILTSKITENDKTIIYFAGHGDFDKTFNECGEFIFKLKSN